jgi:hypothetical protein
MGAENIGIFREKLNLRVAPQPADWYLDPMQIETTFFCVFCFQVNDTLVDVSAGRQQEYTEDCHVCCRPNLLHVTVDPSLEEATVEATTP